MMRRAAEFRPKAREGLSLRPPPATEMYHRARLTKQILIDVANPNELAQSARVRGSPRLSLPTSARTAVGQSSRADGWAPSCSSPARLAGGRAPFRSRGARGRYGLDPNAGDEPGAQPRRTRV